MHFHSGFAIFAAKSKDWFLLRSPRRSVPFTIHTEQNARTTTNALPSQHQHQQSRPFLVVDVAERALDGSLRSSFYFFFFVFSSCHFQFMMNSNVTAMSRTQFLVAFCHFETAKLWFAYATTQEEEIRCFFLFANIIMLINVVSGLLTQKLSAVSVITFYCFLIFICGKIKHVQHYVDIRL